MSKSTSSHITETTDVCTDEMPFFNEVQNGCAMLNVGCLLKEARKKANLTQEELAEKIGTKRAYISRIERDASTLKLATFVKIIEEGLGGKIHIDIMV